MFGKKKSPLLPESAPEKTRAEYTLEYAQIEIHRIVSEIDSCNKKALNEADTCNRFILPFFRAFGWDSYSTVWRSEYSINGTHRHVDYAFSKNGHGWTLIEAKRLNFKNIDRNKNFIKQIVGYFNADPHAHLIILTNGEEYCFYSYGESTEISTTPFIKFNIRNIDVTGNAKFLSRLFRNQFNIGDWSKYAEMSRSLAEIKHSLRKAPESLTKQHLIEKSFVLLYPEIQEPERSELLAFFNLFG